MFEGSFKRNFNRSAATLFGFGALYGVFWWSYLRFPLFHQRYIQGEDRLVEWVTFAGFLLASLFCGCLIPLRRAIPRLGFVYLMGLMLFFFVCAGEELSWGQRQLGFETPAAIKETNVQGEFNIHNMDLRYLSPSDAIMLIKVFGWIAPLLLLPWVWRRESRLAGYVAPPWLIGPFLFADAINYTAGYLIPRMTPVMGSPEVATRDIPRLIDELREFYWGLCVLLAAWSLYRHWKNRPGASDRPVNSPRCPQNSSSPEF